MIFARFCFSYEPCNWQYIPEVGYQMFFFGGISTCHVTSQYSRRKNCTETQIAQSINWQLNTAKQNRIR